MSVGEFVWPGAWLMVGWWTDGWEAWLDERAAKPQSSKARLWLVIIISTTTTT